MNVTRAQVGLCIVAALVWAAIVSAIDVVRNNKRLDARAHAAPSAPCTPNAGIPALPPSDR